MAGAPYIFDNDRHLYILMESIFGPPRQDVKKAPAPGRPVPEAA